MIRALTARGRNFCRACKPEAVCAAHPIDLRLDVIEVTPDGQYCDACGGNTGTLAPLPINKGTGLVLLDTPCRNVILHDEPTGGLQG